MSRQEIKIENLIRCFALLMLFLMLGGQAVSQTALESADKPKASTPAAEPANTSPPVGNSAIEPTGGLASSTKLETDLMNAKADVKPVTTPAPQLAPPCRRTSNAEWVAISQTFILNRLG